jgi:hypothetical protein
MFGTLKRVTTHLDPIAIANIERIAAQLKTSRSHVLRRALALGVAELINNRIDNEIV